MFQSSYQRQKMRWTSRKQSIKDWGRVHLTRTSLCKSLCTIDRDINCYSHYGKQYGGPSKKWKIYLPHGWANVLLGLYAKKMKSRSQRHMCIPMFNAALFIVTVKIWKQHKCPSMDEWTKKCGIYTERDMREGYIGIMLS